MSRLACSIALALLAGACGDDDGGELGADAGPQGPALPAKADPDARELCAVPFEPCGGDVVARWKVRTVCFEDASAILPAVSEEDCTDAVRSISTRAAGSYVFEKNGAASTDVTLALDLDTLWTDACVVSLTADGNATAAAVCNDLEGEYNSSDGIDHATCRVEDDGCACKISSQPSMVQSEGNYALTKDDAIDNGAGTPDPYCVDGDTLRISVTEAGLTGVIVLSR